MRNSKKNKGWRKESISESALLNANVFYTGTGLARNSSVTGVEVEKVSSEEVGIQCSRRWNTMFQKVEYNVPKVSTTCLDRDFMISSTQHDNRPDPRSPYHLSPSHHVLLPDLRIYLAGLYSMYFTRQPALRQARFPNRICPRYPPRRLLAFLPDCIHVRP
ncbi:hypothetical protein Btru_051422 [Bulinus truncatus]|nr:hypothetical protein Btru_051422 [Bulinus truncatus]